MKVAADADRVAGLTDETDRLARIDALAAIDQRHPRHVRVEVAAPLPFAVDQQVVAVENRVIAGAQDSTAANGYQRRAAGGDDVKALVRTAATAGCAEFTDVAAGAVRALDGKDVVAISEAAVGRGDVGGGRCGEGREKEKR
jgi:hypothetical protein